MLMNINDAVDILIHQLFVEDRLVKLEVNQATVLLQVIDNELYMTRGIGPVLRLYEDGNRYPEIDQSQAIKNSGAYLEARSMSLNHDLKMSDAARLFLSRVADAQFS